MKISHLIIYALTALAIISCKDGKPIDTVTLYHGDYCYRGEMAHGKRNGYGVLSLKGSIVYSGMWKDGKRCGYGTTTDSLGRRITALWHADTIVSGTREDSLGIYHGGFSEDLLADGHGTWRNADGEFYTGQWTADRRNGFGCGVAENGKVKAGDWRKDRYRGEKMVHTADRIYGIDVSRYQHEKGKKKFHLDWTKVRVIGLGSGRRSAGDINYRISFAYIKSTEGVTVRNRYFASDYVNAKKRGIAVGAYHFFSTRSSAAAQAHFFLRHTALRVGDMPPVLDVEPSDAQIKQMGGPEVMFRAIRTWLNIVRNATGTKPVLYVSQNFVNRYLSAAPDIKGNYPVWIARYGQYRPDVRLAFWQLTPYGKVRGIQGDVDVNVFNGYKEQFAEFLHKETIKK